MMDVERRAVLKRLQRLNPQGVGIGDPAYSTDVLKGVCDVLEGRVEVAERQQRIDAAQSTDRWSSAKDDHW